MQITISQLKKLLATATPSLHVPLDATEQEQNVYIKSMEVIRASFDNDYELRILARVINSKL